MATQKIAQIKAELTDAAQAGTLTVQQLADAINITDPVGYECIPESTGFAWLRKWLHADDGNVALLTQCIPDMLDLYTRCIDNLYITDAIESVQLLSLIPESLRTTFVAAVLEKHLPSNAAWITVCLEVDIPREFVATLIIKMLRRAATTQDDYRVKNFLESTFLDHGAGRFQCVNPYSSEKAKWQSWSKNTFWSVLSEQELIQALEICIDTKPAVLFGWRSQFGGAALIEKLESRLSEQQIFALLTEAAEKLTSASGVSISVLSRLPKEAQETLIERLDGGTIELLVHVASQRVGAVEYFDRYIAELCTVTQNLVDQFTRLQPQLNALRNTNYRNDETFADHVDKTLVFKLWSNGYRVGTITQRIHKGFNQLCVVLDGIKYVEQRGDFSSSRYYPSVGDRVAFNVMRGYGTMLVPNRVFAVRFVLVAKAKDVARV